MDNYQFYDLLYQHYNLILLFVLVVITAYYAYTNRQIALSAQRQASAAEESLRQLREQVQAQQEVGRMIVENTVQSALAKIKIWKTFNIGYLANNKRLPQTINLVPDQAGSALENASRISKEAAEELGNAFDDLTFAQTHVEILRSYQSGGDLDQQCMAEFLQRLESAQTKLESAKAKLAAVMR